MNSSFDRTSGEGSKPAQQTQGQRFAASALGGWLALPTVLVFRQLPG